VDTVIRDELAAELSPSGCEERPRDLDQPAVLRALTDRRPSTVGPVRTHRQPGRLARRRELRRRLPSPEPDEVRLRVGQGPPRGDERVLREPGLDSWCPRCRGWTGKPHDARRTPSSSSAARPGTPWSSRGRDVPRAADALGRHLWPARARSSVWGETLGRAETPSPFWHRGASEVGRILKEGLAPSHRAEAVKGPQLWDSSGSCGSG